MKQKDKQNYSKTGIQELKKEIESLEDTLKKLRIDRYVKQMKNSREGKMIRKKIAVLKTFIQQKQLIVK